jgi:hypothetical protein
VVEFDQPQTIARLAYEVEEAMRERTPGGARGSFRRWRPNVPPNLGSGVHLQPRGSHLPARRTAAQPPPSEPSPSHDCSKQERFRYGDAHVPPPLCVGGFRWRSIAFREPSLVRSMLRWPQRLYLHDLGQDSYSAGTPANGMDPGCRALAVRSTYEKSSSGTGAKVARACTRPPDAQRRGTKRLFQQILRLIEGTTSPGVRRSAMGRGSH